MAGFRSPLRKRARGVRAKGAVWMHNGCADHPSVIIQALNKKSWFLAMMA
jgi:hypothetical protein